MDVKPVARQVQTVDVKLGPGRQTLRLALVGAGNGEDATLVLSVGFGGSDGAEFLRPPWADLPLRLPAEKIPAVIEALAALDRAGAQT